VLTIEIKLNGRIIGGAKVTNISDLADVSDYEVVAAEGASEVTGLPDFREDFIVKGHERRQTVWALVSKVAYHALCLRADERRSLERKAVS